MPEQMMNTLGAPPPQISEVDFYKCPTILSRLILNQKYGSAIKRLQRFPEEAATWVSSKRNPFLGRAISLAPNSHKVNGVRRFNSSRYNLPRVSSRNLEYSVRQLPIHVACANLLRAKEDEHLRNSLESLIVKLVVAYPNSCHEVDHEGKLPLHEALWQDAKVHTIAMMLIAAPLTLHARDKYGRAPLDLNRFRDGTNKEQINTMLLRGTHFWEQSRRTAVAKMEERRVTTEAQKSDEAGPKILAEPGQGPQKEPEKLPEKVQVTTWLKLERRAIHLEQLLAGMYEKNYELGEMVEELCEQKIELQKENDTLQESAPRNIVNIKEENEALKTHVDTLEEALAEMKEESSSHNEDTVQAYEDKNAVLRAEVDELTSRNRTYQVEVERLELLVESFRRRLDDTEGNTSISMAIQSIPEDKSTSQTDEQTVSLQEFDDLFGAIEEKSHYATERYLARKVRRLQDEIDESDQNGKVQLSLFQQENARLMRENEALMARLAALTAGQKNGQQSATKIGQHKDANRTLGPRENSVSSFASDNLEEIFREAAAMYGGSSGSLSTTDVVKSSTTENRSPGRDQRDVSSATAVKGSSVTSAPLSVPSFCSPDLLIAAKKIYGKSWSPPLDSALRAASLSTFSTTPDRFLAEAQQLYGNPIPSEVEAAIRKAAARGSDEPMGRADQTMPLTRATSQPSRSTSLSSVSQLSVEREVENIIEEAERMHGDRIPVELTIAFQAASVAHFQRKALLSEYRNQTPEEDFEIVFAEAQTIFGKAIPANLAFAIRKASLSSMASGILRSSSAASKVSGQSSVSDITIDDDIENLLDEAERMIGRKIPNDLAAAFRTASIASLSKSAPLKSVKERQPAKHDFEAVLNDTQTLYGKPIPRQLSFALRQASLSSASFSFLSSDFSDLCDSSDVHEPSVGEEPVETKPESSTRRALVEQKGSQVDSLVERKNSVKVKHSLKGGEEGSSRGLEVASRPPGEIAVGDLETDVNDSHSLFSQDDDLDSVLAEAELLAGKKLSPELVAAWNNIAIPSQYSSLATTEFGGSRQPSYRSNHETFSTQQSFQLSVATDVDDVVGLVTDDLEAIFSEAARMYSHPQPRQVIPGVQPDVSRPGAQMKKKSSLSSMSRRSASSRTDHLDHLYTEAATARKNSE